METLLEMYDLEELLNGKFLLKFTTIDHYQREDPGMKDKLKSAKYKKNPFAEAGILLI